MEKLYKVLGKNAEAVNGGNGKWKRNCHWMPPIDGELVPCENGYHLCRKQDLIAWLGPTIWEAEYRGERIDDDNKVVVREARIVRRIKNWDETTARLFAVDCAERVMHLGDEVILSTVLAVVYLYAIGEVTKDDLSTAWEAARAAAWAAAWEAAWAAARDTAWAAARAWAAAWAAAREWQTERLFEYLRGE